jgi:SAM-dependent methyltransferase
MSASDARPLPLRWRDRYPMLEDRTGTTHFDAHYTYHPAWAARIIAQTNPAVHIDIGSTLQFCALISAFVPVEFYDFRPAKLELSGLTSRRGDLTALPFADESVMSLSCMHVVEHVGLGRYGDPLDPSGDIKAMAELRRVVAPGGSLLFVAPVGRARICYNAHRIYSYESVLSQFEGMQLQQFGLIDDQDQFTLGARAEDANFQTYGCGCWWFKK